MFRCIPLFRGCNRQVEYIDKRHSNLYNVPDEVLRYPRTLEELLLDSNHIKDLPKGLFRLVKLRRLSLSDNEIGRLPGDVASLVNLVELDISKNELTDIPENIKFLKSLQNADFSCNPLTKLPVGFVQLQNLTILGLNDVVLSQLPSEFGYLQNLQSLELRENLLQVLPPSFAMLTKLERLDLGSNEINELPSFIGQLQSLQELWLDCNDLYTLPSEIENLKKLTCLDVSENRLETLPDEIGGLENLTDLHLSQNYLESLPEGIGNLKKLTIFKVDQNRISSLPPEIGNCDSLQELILTENLISELPETIGNLVNLTNLNVDRNRLTELPSQIGNLTRLGVLSLRENRLNFLPEETGKLKELHVLDVSGNRLQYLPITITALNLKALWLAENQSQSMLKFQTDINERTGTKVLTCFLLPQQEYHPESMENLLRDSIEQDSRLSWEQKGDRTSSVKFVEENEEDKDDKETQFVRHDTPHPRELKARHNKLLVTKSKNIDGHVVSHDEKDEAAMDSFRPQRSSITSVTSSSSETSGTQFKDAVQSLADIPDSDDHLDSQILEEDESTVTAPCADETGRPIYRAETREDLLDNDSCIDLSEKDLEKHVDFDPETGDQPEEKHNKLHRRDTPHHLKNKRINLIDSQKDQEKVLAILAQEAMKDVNEDTTSQRSMPSSQTSVVSQTSDIENTISSGIESPDNFEPTEVQLELVVHKTSAGLGLSIAGGVGSTPYKGEDEGIFVSKVIPNGPAEISGLKVGDKIISVNKKSLEKATHHDAVDALKTAGNEMMVIVKREVVHPHEVLLEMPKSEVVQPVEPICNAINKNFNSIQKDTTPLSNGNELIDQIHENSIEEKHSKVNSIDTNPSPIQNTIEPPHNEVTNASNKEATSPIYKTKKPENLVITVPQENDVNHLPVILSAKKEEYDVKYEIFHTTLIREQNGLGISIVGNPPGGELGDGNEGIYISKISENGAAAKDGKLKVGDKLLTINGIDMEGARQDQAVALLSGLDRFVRLVAQRHKLVPRDPNAPHFPDRSSITPSSAILLAQKSPKLIGLPRPYTQKFYSSGSYMANRPSYMGGYRRPEISPASSETKTFSIYNKLPGLRNDPLQSLNYKPVNDVANKNQDKPLNTYAETNCVANHIGHKNELEEEVALVKAGGPLGLSIIGGIDHTCHPFGADEPGIFISKIVPEGAAAKTGKLKVGDRLLKVNGADVHSATHKDAVMALLVPTYEMTLAVRHEPLPKGWQELIITKCPKEKLGMGIQGGVGGQPGNPNDPDDEGIFISWINCDGAAGADGRLKPGMRIVEVNETSLLGATYQEAITALRTACDRVRLIVCDGYDTDNKNEQQNLKPCTSSSSIDKENEFSQVFRQEQETIKEMLAWEREEKQKLEQSLQDQKQETVNNVNSNSRFLPQNDQLNNENKDQDDPDYENIMVVQAAKESTNGTVSNSHSVTFSTPMKNSISSQENNAIGFNDDATISPIKFSDETLTNTTSDESILDPIGKARLPSAKPIPPKPAKDAIPDTVSPEILTFSEKKQKFERATKQEAVISSEQRQFSFLSQQELERMQEEEERKLSTMTEEEIKSFHALNYEDEELIDCANLIQSDQNTSPNAVGIPTSPPSGKSRIPIRTVKTEQRLQNQLSDDSRSDTSDLDLTPAQQRAIQAAKRAAWRQARLKSLENDALKAQILIAKAREISRTKSEETSPSSVDLEEISETGSELHDIEFDLEMKSAEENGIIENEEQNASFHSNLPKLSSKKKKRRTKNR